MELSKRFAFVVGTYLVILTGFSQSNPYATLTYDSLLIYDFEYFDFSVRPRKRLMSILDENGELVSTILKSVKLTTNEAKELSQKIGSKPSYGQLIAACFDPHLGMVYYENGQVKEHITICLACNYPKSSLVIAARNQGGEKMEDGSMYYKLSGFSKSFRQYLNDIKKKYNFSAQIGEGSMFD